MRYVTAMFRKKGEGDKIVKPSRLEVWDTDTQKRVTAWKMPEQQEGGKRYSPNGLYVCDRWEDDVVFVGVKDGVVRFENGDVREHLKWRQAPQLIGRKFPQSAIAVAGNSPTSLYWLPTLNLGKHDQRSIRLVGTDITIDADETSLETRVSQGSPVGPLLGLDNGVVFYSELQKGSGKLLLRTSTGLVAAHREEVFDFKPYPQPVAIKTDGELIYTAGTSKRDSKQRLYVFTSKLEEQMVAELPMTADITALGAFVGNYVPDTDAYALKIMYNREEEDITYCLLGGSTGNISVVAIKKDKKGRVSSDYLGELDILGERARIYLSKTARNAAVNNILVSPVKRANGVHDAEILVQYQQMTVALSAYELLTNIGLAFAMNRNDLAIDARGFTDVMQGNPRIAQFDSRIFDCGVLRK